MAGIETLTWPLKMEYFNILNLKKEPFSNSPEPEFLFQLPQYSDCLQKLELAVRLRRGINVIIGDIGTGKTTLCRKLIQNFSPSSKDAGKTEIEPHLLLDPAFKSNLEFLQTFASMLGINDSEPETESEWHLKEKIKDCLFDKGVDEKKIVVLMIDEGQKIPDDCLETLREFLNYETNEFKLLQIIIFAQKEFYDVLKKKTNLLDRVNILYRLRPLNFTQMKAMINYRLKVAGHFEKHPPVFSFSGFLAVYLATGGYPRKVVFLCHQVLLKMIIREEKKAGWFLVRSGRENMKAPLSRKLGWGLAGLLFLIVLGISAGAVALQGLHSGKEKQGRLASTGSGINESAPAMSVVHPSGDSTVQAMDVPDEKMPDALGNISMAKRRTLWWVSYNIYGDNTPQFMEKIFAVNPHIKNKDVVAEGTIITLPAVPADSSPLNPGDILIALESGQDLEIMYNLFRNHPHEQILPPLAFLSLWNKKKGFEFAVVINKCFKNEEEASQAINKLSPSVAAKAKILSQWDADTVFFNRRAPEY
ncbi:MAG TPA: AAA family ATPase [Smithella sp.]|nr:AAA family ATPase [Smithella sp.]